MPAADAVLEYLDPATLIIDTNVRDTDDLDVKDLAANIKANGLLQPIVAWRDGDQVKVKLGKRRTLASLEAGVARVPVLVHPAEPTMADRITDQLNENLHRRQLSDRAEATAVQALLSLGLSAAAIGRRTKLPKARLAAAAAVAQSELAARAMERYDFLTLDHAAALAEFGDDTDRAKRIVACSKENPGFVRHLVQQFRDSAALDAARAAVKAQHEAAGLTVVGEQPGYYQQVRLLTSADGTPVDEDAHRRDCPGHVVHLRQSWDDGERTFEATAYCSDPVKYGHVMEAAGAGPSAAPDPDRELAEKRRVRENNKLWRSATVVRREWLAELARRKSAPPDTARFLLEALILADARMTDSAGHFNPLGCELLGVTSDSPESYSSHPRRDQVLAGIWKASPGRGQVIALTLVLAAYEHDASIAMWRNMADRTKAYLTQLEQWGYTLAPIETEALGRNG